MSLRKIGLIAVTATVAVLLFLGLGGSPVVIVDAGYVGVLKTFGAVRGDTFAPGFHLKIPIIQTVEPIDCRLGNEDADAHAASKDLQVVTTKVSVQFSLDCFLAATMVNNLGDREALKIIIRRGIQESVKATTAEYTAEQLIGKRVEVKSGIQLAVANYITATLSKKSLGALVSVANMSVTDFDFSPEFNLSIEAKVKAEQDALRAENEKKKKITEAEAAAAERRLSAEADAYSVRQKADAAAHQIEVESTARAAAIDREGTALAKTPSIVQLRTAERWNGVLPLYAGSGVLPFLNVQPSTLAPAAPLAEHVQR